MENKICLKNVKIFDGISDKISKPKDLLIVGNKISEINECIECSDEIKVIDCNGKYLMPGLIDMHIHMAIPFKLEYMLSKPWEYMGVAMGKNATDHLYRGFTTVRDAGGAVAGLKQAIDEGVIEGPRIYSSAAMISQTCGHGDFGSPWSVTHSMKKQGFVDRPEELNISVIADGEDEIRKAIRQNFKQGASQIKIMGGGGVASFIDPIENVQYTPREMEAAVDEARRWNTYVMVHAHTDEAIRQSVLAGVLSIEHATMAREDTIREMVDRGVYVCPQVWLITASENNSALQNPITKQKMAKINSGFHGVMDHFADKGVKMLFGTDCFGGKEIFGQGVVELEMRRKWYTNAEILKQATSIPGELLQKSGVVNPYSEGILGVIEEGAYADILILEDNPILNLQKFQNPDSFIAMIIKDGIIHKDTVYCFSDCI